MEKKLRDLTMYSDVMNMHAKTAEQANKRGELDEQALCNVHEAMQLCVHRMQNLLDGLKNK